MMLVCSSGSGCDIRKDWPSQRCPRFKLCGGFVNEKRKMNARNNKYQHMGDAKDFLERVLLLYLPTELIQLVYEFFGPGQVIFDFDRIMLMPKICKIELPDWIEFFNDENTVVAKLNIQWFNFDHHQVIRTIKLACDDWNNTLCEIDYAAVTYPGDHAMKLKYFFNGASKYSETHFVFPKRSHHTVLKYIFPMFGTLPKEWWLNFHGLEDSY